MAKSRRVQRETITYVTDGNTVRVAEPQYAPRVHPGYAPGERDERYRRERARRHAAEQNAQKTRVRTAQRTAAQNARALSIDLPFLLMLTAAVAATLVICYHYLCLTSSIDAHMDRIESLETQLEKLKTENDALEQSIDTSVDLNYVYQVAVGELGMVHAGQENIIRYDKTESEYVRQYEDIP